LSLTEIKPGSLYLNLINYYYSNVKFGDLDDFCWLIDIHKIHKKHNCSINFFIWRIKWFSIKLYKSTPLPLFLPHYSINVLISTLPSVIFVDIHKFHKKTLFVW